MPVRRDRELPHARSCADDIPRSHAAAARRGDAGRFRRQCQPRAAHAARGAFRLHRDPAGLGPRGRQGARALPCHHAGAGAAHGAADRRPAVAVAHRAQCASPARHAGRSRADRPPGCGRAANPGARPGREVRSTAADAADASPATATSWSACSRTWSRTRSNTALRASASTSRSAREIPRRRAGSAGRGTRLRAGHRAGASAATDRALLSGGRAPRAAHRAAPGSGLRWSNTSSTATTADF